MPEDKDFKKLVRSRMEQTGERYTQARAQLRPEAAAAVNDIADPRRSVVPTDIDALVALRAQRKLWDEPRPPAAPPWELMVFAGGPMESVEPLTLSLAKVAALGPSMQGVGYVALGLDIVLEMNAEIEDDQQRAYEGRMRARRVQADLLALVEDRTGFAVPQEADGLRIGIDRFAMITDGGGVERLKALTETGTMIRPGHGAAVDFERVLRAAAALDGRVWIGYGVIAVVDLDIPERLMETAGRPCFTLDVDPAFWTAAGEALTREARALHLPAWPLGEARLQSFTSPARSWTQYRPRWSPVG